MANQWTAAYDVENRQEARYLFQYLKALKVATILVEMEYVDRDYLEDYASYYLECFEPYERYCKRLHFFTGALAREDVERFVRTAHISEDTSEADQLRAAYRGFAVGRPLSKSVIGRTVLAHFDEDGHRHFPVTRAYEPHLFGIRLPIKSLAFQQQDSVVSACATVALWSAFHKAHVLFETTRPSPAMITKFANVVPGETRAMPSESLSIEQMVAAIKNVGLEPETIDASSSTPLSSMIYGYVAMGIPVILLLEFPFGPRHAVTVTGYSEGELTGSDVREPLEGLRYRGQRIDKFYVHDDGIGPFAHMVLIDHVAPIRVEATKRDLDEDALQKQCEDLLDKPYGLEWQYPNKDETRTEKLTVPLGFTVALDRAIRVRWLDMSKWLGKLAVLLTRYEIGYTFKVEDLEWDLRLTTCNEFKADLRRDGLRSREASLVILKPYPKYIWRAIASTGKGPIFEVTADATGVPDAFPFLDMLFYHDGLRNQLKHILGFPAAVEEWTRLQGMRFVNLVTGKKLDSGIDRQPYMECADEETETA